MPPSFRTRSYLEVRISLEARRFQDYLETIGKALREERDRLESHVTQEAEGLDEESRSHLFDHHSDSWHALAVDFPSRFYNSFLAALCAWAEAELVELCRTRERADPEAIRLNELAGSGVRRCSQYLKKVSRIQFPESTAEWQRLLALYEIRNKIVHAAAEAIDLRAELRTLLQQYGCVSHDGVERIQLNEPFCADALATTTTLLLAVERVLPMDMRSWG